MTLSLTCRNPDEAFPMTIDALAQHGVLLPSRNGPVLEYPEPVSVTFTHPKERCLFHPTRDANPYLHFFEPFWILAGRDDVGFLANIVKRFREFSDDGVTFAAAYGQRMRKPVDQVEAAIRRLKDDPYDRRAVLQIRTQREMLYKGKDAACNVAAALKVRDNELRMHVFNRSNDAIWGGPAGGTNHPQFSVLLEYLAGRLGKNVGSYTVTTDSMHVYQNAQWTELLSKAGEEVDDVYSTADMKPFPMMQEPGKFDADLKHTFDGDRWKEATTLDYKSLYFDRVYRPMWESFVAYKAGNLVLARTCLEVCVAPDWAWMADRWLARKEAKQQTPQAEAQAAAS